MHMKQLYRVYDQITAADNDNQNLNHDSPKIAGPIGYVQYLRASTAIYKI